jgi:HlyD family secretion protein
MNKTRAGLAVALLCTVGAGIFWFYRTAEARNAPSFRFATIEKTSLESTVSATGALSAVRTVSVGTQVSGQVSALYVDFNDHVKKGQILARIDATLQTQAVEAAQAALDRAQSQLVQATAEYNRNKQLFDAQVVTATEFSTIQVNYEVGKSNVQSARIDLDKARRNLSYTVINSPIDGVIVSRAVELGQTVAASLSTPEIFRIAENLGAMQILASVDESDIGKILVAQPATFTVAAYPTRTFNAKVVQARLLSAVTDNVVNYTVVLSVDNADGKLLPGMTATVKFLTSKADDVLAVPNSALRFTPTAEMLGADSAILTARRDSLARRAAGTAAPAAVAGGGGPPGPPGMGGGAAPRSRRAPSDSTGTLWVVDSLGHLAPHRVRTGINDGQKTQITSRDLTAGTKVVIGVASAASAASAAASPFQQARPANGPRGPGGF